MKQKKIRIIASGGGTAGHIYPAISVIKTIEDIVGKENCTALFVGAKGKMEERIVPAEGYEIITLPVQGLKRQISIQNIKMIFALIKSFLLSKKIIKQFKPDIIIGFGGYASLPIMLAARNKKIDLYTWEGNSFGGLANKLLDPYVKNVFVSFEGMERFFEKDKIIISGNPIRGEFSSIKKKDTKALEFFGFTKEQKILLIVGGSLGAKAINDAVFAHIDTIVENNNIGVIWQTGKIYHEDIKRRLETVNHRNLFIAPFIEDMKMAYSVCDLITCRSGASTVTEVSLCALPAIFVPSSGVTDDHQTKNAEVLVEGGAALMIKDSELAENLIPTAIGLLNDDDRREAMSEKIKEFANPCAANIIANKLLNK